MFIVILFISVNSNNAKPKPAGVDDGFKGEGAACGTSVVKVSQDNIIDKVKLICYQ